jgi:hypothetical protein
LPLNFKDKVVLWKTIISNFHPKQAKKWIGGSRVSLFELFIAFLTWPNLTCLNRPLSLFFHHQTTLVGRPLQMFERTVFETTTYPVILIIKNSYWSKCEWSQGCWSLLKIVYLTFWNFEKIHYLFSFSDLRFQNFLIYLNLLYTKIVK